MKLDLERKGWESIFLPWQIKVLQTAYEYESGMTSATAWKALKNERSRASVINFLVELEGLGVLNSVKRTGKGGYHSVYSPVYPKNRLAVWVKERFFIHINKELEAPLV